MTKWLDDLKEDQDATDGDMGSDSGSQGSQVLSLKLTPQHGYRLELPRESQELLKKDIPLNELDKKNQDWVKENEYNPQLSQQLTFTVPIPKSEILLPEDILAMRGEAFRLFNQYISGLRLELEPQPDLNLDPALDPTLNPSLNPQPQLTPKPEPKNTPKNTYELNKEPESTAYRLGMQAGQQGGAITVTLFMSMKLEYQKKYQQQLQKQKEMEKSFSKRPTPTPKPSPKPKLTPW